METTAKGKGFLKVTGILMIIGGALGIILGIVALVGAIAGVALGASFLLLVAAIFTLVSAILQLVAGIVGVKNCDKPENAQKCIKWGVIVVALTVLGSLISVIGGGKFDVLSLLIGLVLPALYIYGAIKNKG